MLHAAEHEIVQYLQHNATQLDLVVPCRTLERYTSYTSYTLVAFALSKVIPTVCPWGPQVLTEVQKQMSSLDAEMKEARKDAGGMQQVPLPVDVRTQFSDCG